jgi:hypothetical protein
VRLPALRSPDRPRLPGRVKAASGVAGDGASASPDPADQPSMAAATKGMSELCAQILEAPPWLTQTAASCCAEP